MQCSKYSCFKGWRQPQASRHHGIKPGPGRNRQKTPNYQCCTPSALFKLLKCPWPGLGSRSRVLLAPWSRSRWKTNKKYFFLRNANRMSSYNRLTIKFML